MTFSEPFYCLWLNIAPGWPLKSLTSLSREELKSDFYKFQGRGLTSTHAWGSLEKNKKWSGKKGERILFYFFLKIHIGLNKLRGSAQGILDLGFETERTPLLLAIWLL